MQRGATPVTVIKLDSKPATSARLALEPLAAALYATPGMRIVGVIELAHLERTQPAPESDKEPSVKLRITGLEIAGPEQEDVLREAQRALFVHRTAYGTLNDSLDVELSERTLELLGGQLHALEAARLRTSVTHWQAYIRRVLSIAEVTTAEMRHELDQVADGLAAVLRMGRGDGDDDD
jgi:hypothetical protein